MAKAKQIADVMDKPELTTLNGWFDCWKKQYNIREKVACGESGDVGGETVDSWNETLPELVQRYQPEDIWIKLNGLPDKGFGNPCCFKISKSQLLVTYFSQERHECLGRLWMKLRKKIISLSLKDSQYCYLWTMLDAILKH